MKSTVHFLKIDLSWSDTYVLSTCTADHLHACVVNVCIVCHLNDN